MPSFTRKIAEGTFLVYLKNIFGIFLEVVSSILIIRALGQYQFGLLTLALSFVGMLGPFLNLSIGSVVSSDVAGEIVRNKLGRAKRILRDFAFLEIVLGSILSLSVFVLSVITRNRYGAEVGNLVRIASLMLLFHSIGGIFSTTFYAFSRFRYFLFFDFLENIVRLILVLFFLVFLKKGVVSAMSIYLIVDSTTTIISLPLFFKTIKPLKKAVVSKKPLFVNILKEHGKFQILSQSLKSSLEGTWPWIIGYFAGVKAVATFQVAKRMFSYLLMIVSTLETVLMPILSEAFGKSKGLAMKIVYRSTKYTTAISILIMIGGFLMLPSLLELLFPKKYTAAIPLLYIMLPILLVAGLGVSMRPLFFALKAQKQLLKVHFITILASYSLAVLLTFFYGVVGFTIAIYLAAAYIAFGLRYRYLWKIDKRFVVNPREFLKWDAYDRKLSKRIFRRVLGKGRIEK